jgi:hypothetical protein
VAASEHRRNKLWSGWGFSQWGYGDTYRCVPRGVMIMIMMMMMMMMMMMIMVIVIVMMLFLLLSLMMFAMMTGVKMDDDGDE